MTVQDCPPGRDFNPLLSVIVPFSYRKGDPYCLVRLKNALNCFKGKAGIEVILFDRSSTQGAEMASIASNPGINYFHQAYEGVFSPGQTRNLAVEQAKGQYLFFFDADLLCTSHLVNFLREQSSLLSLEDNKAFLMLPCLYLTEAATAEVLRGRMQSFEKYKLSYLEGKLDLVAAIAVASSCLLVKREWFLTIGRFRSEFAGHGCEDFELIHRLAAFYPIGSKPSDYLEDVKSRFPGDYQGFRRFYSYYSLPHLFNDYFLLHQWHPKPVNRYHKGRARNERLQQRFMSSVDIPRQALNNGMEMPNAFEVWSNNGPLPEWRPWIREQLLSNGFEPEKYCGLFRLAEGVSEKGVFLRRFKKLLRTPGLFVKDAVRKLIR